MRREYYTRQRPPPQRDQKLLSESSVPHVRRRDEDTIPSSLFSFVHGAIRGRNECLEGLAPNAHLCDTEARSEFYLTVFELDHRLLHLFA